MPEKIFLLPEPGAARVACVVRLIEATPDDWSDVSGLLEAPGVDPPAWDAAPAPVLGTGYALHRHDEGVRVVSVSSRRVAPLERPDPADLVSLLLEDRPPAFVSFDDTGRADLWQFFAARALAAGFVRRGYRGWLSLNNGRSEVEIRLHPWGRRVDVGPRRLTLPAVVFRWDERFGGDAAQLEPFLAVCRTACEELREPRR